MNDLKNFDLNMKNCQFGLICAFLLNFFQIEIMSCLKSSHIYYLDLNSITDQNQDVAIKSGSGGQINLNKLFLVPFSPLLTSIFSNIVEETCNFTIITEFNPFELEILSNFCTQGLLPMPIQDLAKEIPIELLNLFKAFGIDLTRTLFQNHEEDIEAFKKENLAGKFFKSMYLHY